MSDSRFHLARDGQVTAHTYRRLGYDRLTQGVYGHWPISDGLDQWEERRQKFLRHVEAVVAAYQKVVLYGPTALQVLGVALPSLAEDWERCHLLVGPNVYRPTRRNVIAHRTQYLPPIWKGVNGLPLLSPVDHLLQLSGTTLRGLIEVGDGLMRRRNPLITLSEMERRLEELDCMPNVARVRSILCHLRPGTESLYETRTRLTLVNAGLPCPIVNLPVDCRAYDLTYHLDMGYKVEKVGIEYDGAVHVGNREQMEFDASRRRRLQDEGWLIITVTAGQLRQPSEFIHSVRNALAQRGRK